MKRESLRESWAKALRDPRYWAAWAVFGVFILWVHSLPRVG